MPDNAVPQPDPPTLDAFPYRRAFPTRWNDNDVFGHVNNTIYYAAMDTTVTTWLTQEARLDPTTGEWIVVVLSSSCRFHESAVFPDLIEVGLRAERLGRTSLVWSFGLFRQSDHALLATGEFVHVVLPRAGDGRPAPIPSDLRARIERAFPLATTASTTTTTTP
jgi:acyl-CoA thioester hydrolase